MGMLRVEFLSVNGAVLHERTVEGDARLLGPFPQGAKREPAFKDFLSNEHPMNKATLAYAGKALQDFAAEIEAGTADNPRVGNDLVFVDVNGTGRIPIMEAFIALPESEQKKTVMLIAEGVRHQAQARRSRLAVVRLV